ncbi:MAG: NAD(+)/NADH kinase [Syntrophobacterales bacterium]|nr:NAD(+)/NADH kinase [Syntrophobacterales bacterium]
MEVVDKVQRVGIVANMAKEKAGEYTQRLRNWCLEQGLEVFLDKGVAAAVGAEPGYERKQLAAMVDIIAVFGGDGTMLRTARAVREFNVPIVGINLGGFGYLTEVNLNEMLDAFEIFRQRGFQTEKRMMLDITVESGGAVVKKRTILNDAVLNRGNLSRIVEMETTVDGRYLNTFKADGLIVSTPTGSTAYSLSAGGPIVFPQHDSIIINPICPHTLTNRPVILPGDVVIRVVIWSKEQGAMVALDGQVFHTLKPGDVMTVRKSAYTTLLVTSPHRDYLEILRSKLGWRGLPAGLNLPG